MSGSWFFPFYFLVISVNLIFVSSAKLSIPGKAVPANFTTLQLVQIIARHGDRAPILPFPNDLYQNASVYSINGWGELSEIGAKQVYELGSYLRQRYDGFLPRKYRKRDFLMLSSDIDRAIMSAEANLAGLYELGPLPRSRDIFREWQPVPIHTIPQEEDNLIYEQAKCPRYSALLREFFHSDEYKNFLDENAEFINVVAEHSGLEAIKLDFEQIFQVQDALRCQNLHNLTLPTWANSTVYEKLQYFKALSFVWRVRTQEMKRLKIGPLLEKLVEEMSAKVEAANLILNDGSNGEEDEIPPYQDPIAYRKMYIFSAHDSTISALLDALNLFNPPHIPPYASALIIELHRTPGTGDFFVELFYKNDTTREPFKLDLAAFCGDDSSFNCSFETFSSYVRQFIPTDWKDECQLQASAFTVSSLGSLPNNSSKSPSPSLMRMAPTDILRHEQVYGIDENTTVPGLHPLGLAPPGLPGFLLSVVTVMSLLASVALLSSFLRHKQNSQLRVNSSYQNLG